MRCWTIGEKPLGRVIGRGWATDGEPVVGGKPSCFLLNRFLVFVVFELVSGWVCIGGSQPSVCLGLQEVVFQVSRWAQNPAR